MIHNMKRSIQRGLLVLLPALTLGLGCASSSAPVRFSQEWPGAARDYEETSQQWTRRGVLRAPLKNQASQLMEVYATYLSTDWRASYVDRQSKLQKLSSARRVELEGEQKETAAKQHEAAGFEIVHGHTVSVWCRRAGAASLGESYHVVASRKGRRRCGWPLGPRRAALAKGSP